MSRITIKDIAKLLDVNPSTVSRALKDHPDISTKMKQTVKKVAKELGYQPNFQAIHFRNRRSGLIGLIVPDMGVFFLPSVIKAIEEETRRQAYNLMVFQSKDYLNREMEIIRICQGFGVDGLLVSLSRQTKDVRHLKAFSENVAPVVVFDRMLADQSSFSIPTVGIQDHEAALCAASHLLEKGYQNIGGVFGNLNLSITKQRYEGYKKALEKYQRPLNPDLVVFSSNQTEAKRAMERLLSRAQLPDAVFAMSDECLVGVMQAVYEHRIQTPQQLAIIAISDGEVPYYMNPKITHILHSGYEIGKNAATLLLDLINAQTAQASPLHIRLQTELVQLESV